jgi:hypothetical protein
MRQVIHTAATADGLELPVVDVTDPAFREDVSDAEQAARVAAFLAEQARLARIPRLLRAAFTRLALRGSVLARGIRASRGTCLGAIETYLMKLRPERLGPWARPIDRRIAASLPALALRLRLHDMARLAADALLPVLRRDPPRPLHLLNLAGGTAVDTLNVLLMLRSEAPELLARPIAIDVLDADVAGPEFGARALRALQAEGAPLHGVPVAFRRVEWDWRSGGATLSAAIDAAREAGAVTVAASEGALFEYGSDGEIRDALERLRCGGVAAVVGSVTRADEPVRRLHLDGGAAIHPRGLEAFRALVAPTGWDVARAIARPFSDHVALVPSTAQARVSPFSGAGR